MMLPLDRQKSADRPTKIQVLLWLCIVLAMVIVSLAGYQLYQVGTHFDDARYIVLAQSLIRSGGYGMINAPGQPEPAKYPFGYPLLLVPFIIMFPGNWDALKLPSLAATILNTILLFWGWRFLAKDRSYWWSLGITGLYAFSPMTIDHTRRIMSEPVFTTFCLIAIILAERAVQGRRGAWWSWGMSAALVFAVFTRTIGIVLVGCVFAYLLVLKRRELWKDMIFILGEALVILGLIFLITPLQVKDLLPIEYFKDENARLLTIPFTGSPPEVPGREPASAPEGPALLAANLDYRLARIRNLFLYGFRQHFGSDIRAVALPLGGGEREEQFADSIGLSFVPAISGYLVSALVIFGLIRVLIQERLPLFSGFAAVYLAILFLWIWNDPRLLYPIQPQIHLALFIGLEGILSWVVHRVKQDAFQFRRANLAFAALFFLLILISLFKSLDIDDSRNHAGDIQARSRWLTSHTSTSAIVMTEAPEPDYLYAQRKTVNYPPGISSAGELDSYLNEHGIDYVLVAPEIKWQSTYRPRYSAMTFALLSVLPELGGRNRVIQVYSSEQDLVRIYKVQQEAGSVRK